MKIVYGVLLFFLIGLQACQSQGTPEPIEAIAFREMIRKTSDAVILDVRTKEEFAEGHLAKAVNLDYYQDNFKSDLDNLDKSKTYFLYCTVGGRSGSATALMRDKGFTKVNDLKGGLNEWENKGLPITLNND